MPPIKILQYAGHLVIIASWLVFVAIFVFRKRPPKTKEKNRDNLAILGILFQILGYAVIWRFQRQWSTALVPDSLLVEGIGTAFAAFLSIVSVVVVIKAVKTLGKQWALEARVVEQHKLIIEGPYKHIRHPIYAGMFGLLIATGLVVSRPWAILLAISLFLIGFYIRIIAEERLLSETFKDEFEQYTRRVPALFPNLLRNVSGSDAV